MLIMHSFLEEQQHSVCVCVYKLMMELEAVVSRDATERVNTVFLVSSISLHVVID